MWALLLITLVLFFQQTATELTPPYFNLAEGRKIHATATCGVDSDGPELYCKLVGANTENEHDNTKYEVIQGQVCDYCDPRDPSKSHPPEYAIDGSENWWQSPPLSRGMKYNEVNVTIDFGQEFHVAYLFMRMGNSPRPGLWTLEKSNDYGKTWTPWQHFSDSPADCETYFGRDSLKPIENDDDVICTTEYSKIVPLESGEIPITLLTGRPSANDYFNSPVLQEWTRATNVRIRLLRTKNLLGHLMSVARQDPTVTRRYFYSIKDISIGGRCVCNGHASTCSLLDPRKPERTLACLCQHHTCGIQCDQCCPGYEQKKWRQNTNARPFQCEPCNCHGHSNKCRYDEDIDMKGLSLDIHGNYEGGGHCLDCQHNTEGINCNQCKEKYYRPRGKYWNETDVCQPCDCQNFYSTGSCAEETGKCECRKEFQEPDCDSCSYGHFGYPDCRPCECNLNGTDKYQCEAIDGVCSCKYNFDGDHCDRCAAGFYNFSSCTACECNSIGSTGYECEQKTGECQCKSNFAGKQCDTCKDGYYRFPDCNYCNCDLQGTISEICDKDSGKCLCREGYGGPRCDQCLPGYYGYPDCVPCNCSAAGSVSTICDASGRCPCISNFGGKQCTSCQAGYYQYPECLLCNCDPHGSIGISCNTEGQCQCANNFDGKRCNLCKEGYYNYPSCEECNCDPAGVISQFAGCASMPAGELCQCKERVQGRICDQCRPLYWNLSANNFHGCEECDCYIDGTIGALDTCDTKTGQCTCKPGTTSRNCGECKDGTFDLFGGSLFGCKDCGCDIGGSMHSVCNKASGQCKCHPRVSGRKCDHPLTTHFYPTLYQFQFEYEDGYTPSGAQVRYQYNDTLFPDFSKKGFAVFSSLQNEILNEVQIYKSSVYRLVIRYINPTNENVVGTILITSDNPLEEEQKAKVLFKPTKAPQYVTVSGTKGDIPSPVVLDPGRYTIATKLDKPMLLLDYFVLLPAAYYEASILTKDIENPCEVGGSQLCRHYSYPDVKMFSPAYEPYTVENGEEYKVQLFFNDYEHLTAIDEDRLPLLSNDQDQLNYRMDVKDHGKYVLVVDYITDKNFTDEVIVSVNQKDEPEQDGVVTVYPCYYSMVCRQPVIDREAREKIFFIDVDDIRPIEIKRVSDVDIAIKSVTAIPYEEWSTDYIKPNPVCVYENGACVQSTYQPVPEARKIDFVSEVEGSAENNTALALLDPDIKTISITSSVPQPTRYNIVLHFHQPSHSQFDLYYNLTTERQAFDGKVPVKHCPSPAGCRTLITQDNGYTAFEIDEGFTFNLTNPHKSKAVFLNYILMVPADEYKNSFLDESTYDQTKEFIKKCGQDHFYISLNASDFCKQAVFSLTTAYNDGALQCNCDYVGSTSFECEPFGGQCQCKPNVIGRQCDACRTGFYGFPDCKPCNCPASTTCEKDTGKCICPDRVQGDKCNECVPLTFGFDPIIGCEECNCHSLGVRGGNLQCDLNNGSCPCRENIVGRSCDQCEFGHFNFPHCDMCNCNRDGTTFEICDPVDERCFCKKHVEGYSCERCKDGYYNLQKSNPEGCTKCFCFGKTNRCEKAYLKPFNVSMLTNVTVNRITIENGKADILQWEDDLDRQIDETTVKVNFNEIDDRELLEGSTYFGCLDYLLAQNSHLSAYGGYLTYKILFANGPFGGAIIAPDIILRSKNTIITHQSYEQPAPRQTFNGAVQFIETNFYSASGMPVTREQFMTVLRDLDAIYIRASYWENGLETTLSDVYLTMADEDPDNVHEYKELSVERCDCPPGYQGNSCEDCAPGYYRDPDGPYGGYCVPCDCNGHAQTCDCNTGICHECDHHTTGDHCEMCIEGYYGNATYGSPYDCMICACPLPIESNNFAYGCEVSEDGYRIHCTCKPGYNGEKCQSCAPGFFGQPEIEGEFCKPCQCSGNIDPDDQESCDTVSGECLKCLNNTSGPACNLCAPGYFGDAVQLKDCTSCFCDKIGTEYCDSFTGTCKCHPNVIGEKCDRCLQDHYGFDSGYGCQACDCAIASNSTQCDDHTGQCACKPGVTGKHCDRCLPGYWNYGPDGCEHCKCKTEFSRGLGCDSKTGQCQCLPGVVGDKCDSCPYRWVLIQDAGCFECDECHHALLDVTDELRKELDTEKSEFDEASQPYFTARKLEYYDDAIDNLAPLVSKLDPKGVNLTPFSKEIDSLLFDAKSFEKRVNFTSNDIASAIEDGGLTQTNAEDVLDISRFVNNNARNSVKDVKKLADSLDKSESTKVDLALSEAQSLLDMIKKHNESIDLVEQVQKSEEALNDAKEYNKPVQEQADRLERLKDDIGDFDAKLEDLFVRRGEAMQKADNAEYLNGKNKRAALGSKFETIGNHTKLIKKNLEDGQMLINDADREIENIHRSHLDLDSLSKEVKEINNAAEVTLEMQFDEYSKLNQDVRNAQIRADELASNADVLKKQYSDGTSHSAVKAVRAFDDIVTTANAAKKAANTAYLAAGNATDLTDGIGTKAGESDQVSRDLLNNGREALRKVQTKLQPHIESSANNVAGIKDLNQRSDDTLLAINSALDTIPEPSNSNIWNDAIENAEEADDIAQEATELVMPINKDLPESMLLSKQIPKEMDETSKSISQINTHLDRVNHQVPEILKLDEDVRKAQDKIASKLSAMQEQMDLVRQNIKLAREKANDIKVGLTFYPNTTLELKPPENLAILTNTQASTYFKTRQPNGFLFYLGNEVKEPGRRGKNEDYMALELENGYPVLNIDLGHGPEKVIGKKYVADDRWYQAIVDRSGNKVKLLIRDENDAGEETFAETPYELPGDQNLFSWDENSRIFVGGYPPDYKMQDGVTTESFSGEMEEFKVGDQHISLWNFVDGQSNTDGAGERDRLRAKEVPTNGLRFGGNGYVALDAKPYSFRHKSSVGFKFKAARDAPDGLLFYSGTDKHFIAVELKDGDILFQFKLGQYAETIKIQAPQRYNDDKWHNVLAEREGRVGVLKVDDKQLFQSDDVYQLSPSRDDYIEQSDVMYFGGVPKGLSHSEVTSKSFDGCIEDVQIAGTSIDLNRHITAYDVRPGCPVKFSTILSYKQGEPGYLKNENITANNNLIINLKFRTREEKGLIFFVTNNDQTSTLSLAIDDGILVLRSNRKELNTGKNRYDNGEWHVVTATHESNRLRLSIDDIYDIENEEAPPPLYIQYGDIFFGGVPKGYRTKTSTTSTDAYFLGCISDVTINSNLINFAQSTDRENAVLDQCPRDLFEYDPDKVPTYYPDGRIESKPLREVEEPYESPETNIDVRTKPDEKDKDNEIDTDEEPSKVATIPPYVVPVVPTTSKPTTTKRPTTKRPLPKEGVCAFDPVPVLDVGFEAGYRLGTDMHSHLEYDVQQRSKKQYSISLEFKTSNPDGILFYASDEKHSDFIGVFLLGGRVYHSFNCGSGTTNMSSTLEYNDNEWHTIKFTRTSNRGKLIIDETDISDGESTGTAKTMQLVSPYYVGGYPDTLSEGISKNLKWDKDQLEKRIFFGCIRNIKLGGDDIGEPKAMHSVQPCSEQIEPGMFFEGGYIKLRDKFRVGSEMKISFDIKPRSPNGFLMSVHGKKAFLILQMINGTIHFSVDNGDGAIVAVFKPEENENFCDGEWRTITATKSLYVATISVNNVASEPAIGNPDSVSTDTTRPLFLGGHPHIKKIRGLLVREPFLGCIKNIRIKDVQENVTPKMINGKVQAGVCPLT